MKNSITFYLAAISASGLLLSAAAQPADQPPTAWSEGQFVASAFIGSRGAAPQTPAPGTNQNDLNLDFANAPLDQVLAYLSDAAGFIIVQQARVGGYVTIQGAHITQDEAVNLLNHELSRNNYAAVRDGRMLTIMNASDARTSHIPVKIGNDPQLIPNTDEIATWIVPIRFVEARQLVSDLSLFVSRQAVVVANEAGNSIVITDTQSNIRHLAKIIQAVDNSAEAETEIRVFPLKFASPLDVADELSSVFPGSSSGDSQAPVTFGGLPGGPGGGFTSFSGNGGTTASGSEQRIQKAKQVTTVADPRTQAVIVTAPKNLMNQIAGIVASVDVPSNHDQQVAVIQLQNGDRQQVAQVLQGLFSSGSTSSTGSSSQNSALMQRSANGVTTMGSTTTTSGLGSGTTGGGGQGGGGGRAAF